MSFLSDLFGMTLTPSEEAFQQELEKSKKEGTLPRISRNGTLHISAANVRHSKSIQRIREATGQQVKTAG